MILLLAAVVAVATAAVAAALASGAAPAAPQRGETAATAANDDASLRARFARLSRAHSNRCDLAAAALAAMRARVRLQGACCSPMDYQSYVHQVRELAHRYGSVDVIPKDPYDIPVSLARRLLAYRSIQLTAAQRRTYEQAKPLSDTNGPCCCPCWRWDAFEGQAKYLIARRRYSAQQIADVWSLEEGCGGPSHSHG